MLTACRTSISRYTLSKLRASGHPRPCIVGLPCNMHLHVRIGQDLDSCFFCRTRPPLLGFLSAACFAICFMYTPGYRQMQPCAQSHGRLPRSTRSSTELVHQDSRCTLHLSWYRHRRNLTYTDRSDSVVGAFA